VKPKRKITPEYIRTRFYVMFRHMPAGQRQGVWEALKAMEILAEEDPPRPQQEPLVFTEPVEAEEGEAD
jgi:hypothetical protein